MNFDLDWIEWYHLNMEIKDYKIKIMMSMSQLF